jgi:hypothetical protein
MTPAKISKNMKFRDAFEPFCYDCFPFQSWQPTMKIMTISNLKATRVAETNCAGRRAACRVLRLAAATAAFLCTLAILTRAGTNTFTKANGSEKNMLRQTPKLRTAGTPQYQIYDIGVVLAGDDFSQGFGVSPGGIAVGRSLNNTGSEAFSWTLNGGIMGLPNLAGRSFAVSNSANDSGTIVGTAATTAFGSGRLPVVWQNGAVSQLPLPTGQTLGDANSVNSANIAVGSVDSGSTQRGVIYSGGSATIITQTTANGSYFLTAFGINDPGQVVGQGIDPQNAARNVGIVYDIGQSMAFEVGALPGMNGALAFGVSNTGYVVGSSMQNQGPGMPFIWSDQGGMVAIPLATGTSEGSARAVNSAGWVVGDDSSAFSIPFLYDGTATYRLADLIPPNSGWDLSMNTSSSALGVSEDGVIVGTGVHNGDTHAYAMVPTTATPTPTTTPRPTPTPRPRPAPRPRPTPL